MITHTLTDDSITVLTEDFEPKTMPASHPAFDEVVKAVKIGDSETVNRLIDLPNAIVNFMQGAVTITDRALFFNGKPLDTHLTRRILRFMGEGHAELANPLINFLNKVMENPSYRAVNGLYEWCEKSGLPITPEGDIIAYKIVKEDYFDIYSGRFDNSIGKIVEVARWEVDEDPDRTCSHGLHVCSPKYLPHYGTGPGNHVMVVKIHPKNFVAVPKDYNTAKARVCRYEVIGEMPREKAAKFFPNLVTEYDGSNDNTDPEGALKEEPLLDRYYRTRSGRVVLIEAYDHGEDYPFIGRFIDNDEEGEWGEFGSWNLYEDHDYDLVDELAEDFDPDAEEPAPEAEEPRRKSWLEKLFTGE